VPDEGYTWHEGSSVPGQAFPGCKQGYGGIDLCQSTQFGPNEDFGAYPRDLERDAILPKEKGWTSYFVLPRKTFTCRTIRLS
jgi:hypothetical protein